MRQNRTWRRNTMRRGVIAASAAGALVLTACGGDGGAEGGADNGNGDAADAVEGGGTVSVYNCEPQNLEPGNSSEVCGSKILDQLFTPLTAVDYDTFEAIPGVATEWETEDQITWTFTLGEDWTFHNGDPVTAQSFVDSWNWVVDPDNGQQNASFHDKFLGYEDVIEGDAEEMEGVRAVDEYTLELELSEPFSPLPLMFSYTGFYPMPEEAFEDMNAFQDAPIGNGRYQMDGEWVRDQEVNMDRFEDWAGEEPGLPERIEWRIYNEVETAYLDAQAGELDILEQAPPNRLAQVEADFGENTAAFETSSFTYMGFPLYQEEFQDVDVRHAMSMAIDRDEIIENIFDGSLVAASNIIPPMLPQASDDACGEWCEFDPDAAAELYEEADGPSELTIYFNSGAGHEDWTESVANQWQQNLGVESVNFESLEFAQYLDLHDDQEITGPYRLGWVLSYPSPQYAMEPIYTTGQSSNYATYSNDEFDDLISGANAEGDMDAADQMYQDAEGILLEEMPVIPMWFGESVTVHTDRIDNESLFVDPRTFLRVEQVVVTEE